MDSVTNMPVKIHLTFVAVTQKQWNDSLYSLLATDIAFGMWTIRNTVNILRMLKLSILLGLFYIVQQVVPAARWRRCPGQMNCQKCCQLIEMLLLSAPQMRTAPQQRREASRSAAAERDRRPAPRCWMRPSPMPPTSPANEGSFQTSTTNAWRRFVGEFRFRGGAWLWTKKWG